MSFISVKDNCRSRFSENVQFLNYINNLEPTNPRDTVPLEVNILKGLFYVHLYSSLEKTINELTEHTILLISAKSITLKHYNESFKTIALVDKLKSFKSCGHKNFFAKAYDLFSERSVINSTSLSETVFSNSLQNVWFDTIVEISNCFGVKGLIVTPRLKATINEIVERRNAVAHGREKASDVGSRFRCDILRLKTEEIINFSYFIIELYETYFDRKDYLKRGTKRLYL